MKPILLRAVFGATSLVASAALSLAHAQTPTPPRTSAFEYDPASGLLTKEIIEPDVLSLCLATTYTYDNFGNKTGATTAPCDGATGDAVFASRTSTTTFADTPPSSPAGQFPTHTTNALGHTEVKAFDPNFGNVTSLTGPNGLTTTWTYDNFGRKTQETRADGTKTQWQYSYCSGVNGGTAPCTSNGLTALSTSLAWVVTTTQLAVNNTPNGPYTKTYFDAPGREVVTETQGYDGSGTSTLVFSNAKLYNNLGLVTTSAAPFYAGQAVISLNEYVYDALQRPVIHRAADEDGVKRDTRTTYNGLVTIVINAKEQKRTTTKNSQGQVIQVKDADNKLTTFAYDAFGNLTTTTDALGNITTVSYDARGRKTQMVDPNMGTWSYAYNALGELVRQTDAKGQVSTMAYDKLGRMTQRSEPDLISNWYFDAYKNNVTCNKGIGKLCQAETSTGYARAHLYDTLGRLFRTNTQIDALYSDIVAYDANTGRVSTQTYPAGLITTNVYTPLGYLKEVRRTDSGNNALVWRADTRDAQGRTTLQTYGQSNYGGAIPVNHSYNPHTTRLSAITAGAGNSIQNQTYTYDWIGNVTGRTDNANPGGTVQENFTYDTMNRLASSSVNSGGAGAISKSYVYDAVGNITTRSDVGGYVYNASGAGSTRPHAVNRVNLPGGGYRTYSYDANGSMVHQRQYDASSQPVAAKERTQSYTSYNMMLTVAAPGYSAAFGYGPEHQRILQNTSTTGYTAYLNPGNSGQVFFERDIKANNDVEIRNFITVEGRVVAILKQLNVGGTASVQTRWLHLDALGSTTAVTDQTGAVVERLAYEPFGKRRMTNGVDDPNNTITPQNTERGFTFHEHLDELGLVHMNARIYDPWLGRFMSADPFIQDPHNTQSLNRYTYVYNSPLMYTDPSGYFSLGKLFRTVVAIYVAFQIGVTDGGIFATSLGSGTVAAGIANGAAGGFAAGLISSGGDFKAALQGSLSGAIFGGIGAYGSEKIGAVNGVGGAARFGTAQFVAAHATAGCVLGATTGGGCGPQALSAGFAKWATLAGPDLGGPVANGIKATVIGGTASVLGGGKFENGASTAAYAYTFNHLALAIQTARVLGPPIAAGLATQWDRLKAGFNALAVAMSEGADSGGDTKPPLSDYKDALDKVHDEVGKLPKGEDGKFGSPQAGDSKKGYRLDPPHDGAAQGDAESKHHFNWWDYTGGKRGKGGRSGAIPIGD